MLEAFVSKSILYVYQNARKNQRKNAPKKYKMYPKKVHFLACSNTPIVCFHMDVQLHFNT